MPSFEHLWAAASPHLLHVWGVVGPLAGVIIGGWLTTSSQRKLWLLDNKRAEYRTILTTLSECWSHFALSYGEGCDPDAPHLQSARMEATRTLANVTGDRLFIADEIKNLRVSERFTCAAKALKKDHDGKAFSDAVDAIMDDVRMAARKDFSSRARKFLMMLPWA